MFDGDGDIALDVRWTSSSVADFDPDFIIDLVGEDLVGDFFHYEVTSNDDDR